MARNEESPTAQRIRTRRHKPCAEDRRHAHTLASLGLPAAHIAALIRNGISEETLTEQYTKELAAGRAQSALKIAVAIHNRAENHQNVSARALSLRNASQPATTRNQAPEPTRPDARQSDTLLPQKQKRFVLIDGGTGEPIV